MFCVLKVGKGRMRICIKKSGSIHRKCIDAINHVCLVLWGSGSGRGDWILNCILFFFLILFIYLAVQVLVVGTLSCSIWDLVPRPGNEPRPPTLGVQSLSH